MTKPRPNLRRTLGSLLDANFRSKCLLTYLNGYHEAFIADHLSDDHVTKLTVQPTAQNIVRCFMDSAPAPKPRRGPRHRQIIAHQAANERLHDFVHGYMAVALTASLDDQYEPLNQRFKIYDFNPASRARLVNVATLFYQHHAEMFGDAEPFAMGECLWLSQNGFTGGFDESHALEDTARYELHHAAEQLGELHLSAEEGQVYVH